MADSHTIRVLIADDHELVRAGIKLLLQSLPHVEVVAEANEGRTAVTLAKKFKPDVVLMDIAMPELNGLEATRRLTKEMPEVQVLVLSMHATEEYLTQALRAGARGFLLKGASIAELEIAIKAVARGEVYLTPAVSKHVVADYLHGVNKSGDPLEVLSPRQREILQAIAEGKTTKEIAIDLNISIKTVETHRAQLMDRLNIHDIPGLVRIAIKRGLVKID